MHLYDAKIRLAGSVLNEVRKTDLTAAEIEILRVLHGADAVVDIVATRNDKRSHADERKRLYTAYAGPEENNGETLKRKVQMIRDLFGHDSVPLPDKLADPVPDVEEVERPKRITKVEAPAQSPAVLA